MGFSVIWVLAKWLSLYARVGDLDAPEQHQLVLMRQGITLERPSGEAGLVVPWSGSRFDAVGRLEDRVQTDRCQLSRIFKRRGEICARLGRYAIASPDEPSDRLGFAFSLNPSEMSPRRPAAFQVATLVTAVDVPELMRKRYIARWGIELAVDLDVPLHGGDFLRGILSGYARRGASECNAVLGCDGDCDPVEPRRIHAAIP